MPFLGPLEWDERFGEGSVSLAGRPLLFSPELLRMDRAPDASLLPMADGSTVAQSQIVGPDAPAGRVPMRASFDLVLGSSEDLATLQLAEALAEPVLFVPGWWHLDAWRRFLGRQAVLHFTAEAAVAAQNAPVSWPHEVPGRIAPIPGHLTLHALPQGGVTSGSTQVDLELWTDGAWSSVFPAGVLPAVLFDGEVDAGTLPEVLTLPPGSLLRAVVVSLPDVPPTGVVMSLTVSY